MHPVGQLAEVPSLRDVLAYQPVHVLVYSTLPEMVRTGDSKYSVTPMGRLIIVKNEEYVSNDKYESLRKDLERHYKNDRRVNRVYISQGGTVVIDCRN